MENESRQHINVLELTAGFTCLKTFAKKKENIPVRLRIDKTTAVSTINHMGTIHLQTNLGMVHSNEIMVKCIIYSWETQCYCRC